VHNAVDTASFQPVLGDVNGTSMAPGFQPVLGDNESNYTCAAEVLRQQPPTSSLH
jgi:hypothetical protein